MKEASLWAKIRDHQTWRRAHLVRIENSVEAGTLDVNGCHEGVEAWIELKVAQAPKRPDTPLVIDHFTWEQRRWLMDRWQAGGNAWLLVQLDDEYLLFAGHVGAVCVGTMDCKRLRMRADYSGPDLAEVFDVVFRGRK